MSASSQTFWVVERFENGKSGGYWDGGNSRSFVPQIKDAIWFCRKRDAFWVTRGWHWKDTDITEHAMFSTESASSNTKGE